MENWDFLPDFKERLRENRVVRVFLNSDLRCSHDGLNLIAKSDRIDPYRLKVGEYIVFINSKKTQLKLFAAGNTVAHFKMPHSRKMNLKVIGLIPKFFNGKELQYEEALAEVIRAERRRS